MQTDARLFVDGLQLNWRTPEGAQAQVTLDLEFCEGETKFFLDLLTSQRSSRCTALPTLRLWT